MLDRFTSPFREFGFLAGTAYVGDRVLSSLSPRMRLFCYEFMVQPVPDKPLLPPRRLKSFQVREIHQGSAEIALMKARPDIIELRFGQHATCLGTFQGDRLIGYIWFCFGVYEEDEVRCQFHLEPNNASAFDFDVFVFPEHRLGLGFIAVWESANRFLRDRGILYSFSRVSRFNLASRRAHKHLNARCIGRCLFLRFFRIELMLATVSPFVALSSSAENAPKLQLRARNSRQLESTNR